MCLFDLFHGRRRTSRIREVQVPQGVRTAVVAPDARRVAISFCAQASTLVTQLLVFSDNPSSGTVEPAIFNMTPTERNVMLRVEDFGDLVMGGFSVLQPDAVIMAFGVCESLLNESYADLLAPITAQSR